MFGIQPETEICVLSWGYKLMHHKVQLPVLFKSHDHMLLKMMTPSLAQLHWGSEFPSHEEILWENRWRKSSGTNDVPEMVLVFTLLSKHRDQNPEARAVSAGALWVCFYCLVPPPPLPALTNFPTGCSPQNSFERQFLKFLVINRKLVHTQSYSFSNSQVLFQFLWVCASTIQLCPGSKAT